MKLRATTCMLSLAIVCAVLPGIAPVSGTDNIEPLSSFDQALVPFGIDDKQDVPAADADDLHALDSESVEHCAYLKVAPPSREADDSMLVPPPTQADQDGVMSELSTDVVCHPVNTVPEHLNKRP